MATNRNIFTGMIDQIDKIRAIAVAMPDGAISQQLGEIADQLEIEAIVFQRLVEG